MEFLFGSNRCPIHGRRKCPKSCNWYNVPDSPCNRLTKRKCETKRGCQYTIRGCRRAPGYRGMTLKNIGLLGNAPTRTSARAPTRTSARASARAPTRRSARASARAPTRRSARAPARTGTSNHLRRVRNAPRTVSVARVSRQGVAEDKQNVAVKGYRKTAEFEFGQSKCAPFRSREPCENYRKRGNYPCFWKLPKSKSCATRYDAQPRSSRYYNFNHPSKKYQIPGWLHEDEEQPTFIIFNGNGLQMQQSLRRPMQQSLRRPMQGSMQRLMRVPVQRPVRRPVSMQHIRAQGAQEDRNLANMTNYRAAAGGPGFLWFGRRVVR
jgi:hypothetical protein